MRERRGANWRGLSGQRRCKVCIVQHRVDPQPRQDPVHWYTYGCTCCLREHVNNKRLDACVFASRSKFLYMRQWRGAGWRGLTCERRFEMCFLQFWMDNQRRENQVYSYVPLLMQWLVTHNRHKHTRYHCVVNTCKCLNGVAQSGVACPVAGAANCLSCNTGWTINHDRTECIRTCKQSLTYSPHQNEPCQEATELRFDRLCLRSYLPLRARE